MTQALIELGLFTAKSMILVFFILIVLVGFFMILAKSKEKQSGRLSIKNLNDQYEDTKQTILHQTLTKKQFKQYLKDKKAQDKNKDKEDQPCKHIYVLSFNGDIKASAVSALGEEITAILNVAKPSDEVVLKLESPGGVVHGYGLAAAQLMRLREKNIRLTVAIDKVAASGGYMMACVANHIIAAPFAIIGSIGVIIQMPNFNRLLKDNHIDFEQHTAGNFKRTITVFGENTDEGRHKLKTELEDIHHQFKDLILKHRSQINIEQVATGEHWLGEQALKLNLVDQLQTSDDYLLAHAQHTKLFEITYEIKKPLLARLTSTAASFRDSLSYLFAR